MPTNKPATRIIIRDITPVKYSSFTINLKRLKQDPEFSNISTKKRVEKPMRHIASITRCPIFFKFLTAAIRGVLPDPANSFRLGNEREQGHPVHRAQIDARKAYPRLVFRPEFPPPQ